MNRPTMGAAPSGAPCVYPARTVVAVVCDECGAGHSLTIVDPDRGAGWAALPDGCRNGHSAGWRVMAVPGDGSRTMLSAAWANARAARFPSGRNPFAPDHRGRGRTPSGRQHPRRPRPGGGR